MFFCNVERCNYRRRPSMRRKRFEAAKLGFVSPFEPLTAAGGRSGTTCPTSAVVTREPTGGCPQSLIGHCHEDVKLSC